jgi:hypothetical protein
MKLELEEAAKGYSERHQDVSGTLGKYLVSAVFQDGADWQAKRMYSEEEVKLAYNEGQVSIISANYIRTEEWFEQFKKK